MPRAVLAQPRDASASASASASAAAVRVYPLARTLPYARHDWPVGVNLPQGVIDDAVVDRHGFVWLATASGVVRFDGRHFLALDGTRLPSLVSDRASSLAPSRDGTVWVGTPEGRVARLRGLVVVDTLPTVTGGDPRVVSLTEDRDGRLYALTSTVLLRWQDRRWQSVLRSDATVGALLAVAASPDGHLRVTTDRGVLFVRAAQRVAWLPVRETRTSAESPGRVWVGGMSGLRRFTRDGKEVMLADTSVLRRTPIRAIGLSPDSALWIGSNDGIWTLCARIACGDTAAPVRVDTARTPMPMVARFAFPVPGVVVVATRRSGVHTFTQRLLSRPEPASGTPLPAVHHVAVAPDGALWLGGGGCSGLWIMHRDTVRQFLPPAMGLSNACVKSLLRGRDGAMYIGQANSLTRIAADGRIRVWKKTDGLGVDAAIGPLLEDRSGRIWIASDLGLVATIDRADRVVPDTALSLPSGQVVWSIAQDSAGRMVIGGTGVMRIRQRTGVVRRMGQAEGVPRGALRVLLADPDGTLWIGSYGGGLAALRGEQVTAVRSDAGPTDPTVSSMQYDRADRIWLSGNAGITMMHGDALRAWIAGQRSTLPAVLLGAEDDVPEGNGGHPASALLPDGRLAVATVGGVVLVTPDRADRANGGVSEIAMDGVVLDGRTAKVTDGVVDANAGHAIEVQFAIPRFAQQPITQPQYRFGAGDTLWHDLGPDLMLRSANLRAGTHELFIRSPSMASGMMVPVRALRVRVRPRWYEANAFRLLVGMLLSSTVAGVVFVGRRRLMVRHAVEVEQVEQRRKVEGELSDVRARLAQVDRRATAGELTASLVHEIGQPLTAMVSNAEAGRRLMQRADIDPVELDAVLGDIAREGQRAASVIRELRSFLRRGEVAMAPMDLAATVAQVFELMGRGLEEAQVHAHLEVEPDLPPILGDAVLLPQVVVNLVTNAIDALRQQPVGERCLLLRVQRAHSGLRLTVCDSGPGIAAADRRRVFDPFHTTKPDGMGIGLSICRTIVDAHGGTLQLRAGPMQGCAFSFVLPMIVEA